MIRAFTTAELSERCGGQLLGQSFEYSQVSTDSRACAQALFVALRGERFDGHRFVTSALDNAALGVVVEELDQELEAANTNGVLVSDSREALGWAGALNREAFAGKVIGLTGSSGKTTTKNMLTAILSGVAPVVATEGNYNNEIGVPLTLLRLEADTRYAVVEMGARQRGDIRYLGQFVQPDVAVVLNAGLAHIGEFGSREAIRETKGEIYESIRQSGVAVLNLDDEACAAWAQRVEQGRAHYSYSLSDTKADLLARDIECDVSGSRFEICEQGASQRIELPLPGRHNVSNAMAAAAIARVCGVSLQDIAKGLKNMAATEGRMQRVELSEDFCALDDSYNANPVSVKAALDVLKTQPGLRVAVLGEMGELGDEARHYHREVAAHAREAGIEHLFCIGPYAADMVEEFGAGGQIFESKRTLTEQLLSFSERPAVVLVKGSRSAGMEVVIEQLRGGLH